MDITPEEDKQMNQKQAESGTWELRSPSGEIFKAESPIKCCREEQKIRVPLEVRAECLADALSTCMCGEGKIEYILAKTTPAELHVCLTCKNAIIGIEVEEL